MKRVLFVQPFLNPPGGGCGVAAWMLDRIAARTEVTLLTTVGFDPQTNDRYYGTSLTDKPIKSVTYARGPMRFLERLGLPTAFLRLQLVMRAGKKHAKEFDFVFSACDEMDLGRPCVEYVHFPWGFFPRPDAPVGWNDSPILLALLRLYRWSCLQLSGFSGERRAQNVTFVNSGWTGGMLQSVYPENSYRILYPPALAQRVDDNRERRELKFLSIGRVSPSKKWERLIEIVQGLRDLGHQVGLTLAGSRDDPDYEALVREKMDAAGPWVTMINDFGRDQLQELMLTHEFGLHGMEDEHYGMAVAELLLGGCLTAVPASGGQMEIVTDERLQYRDTQDAIAKLDRVLKDKELKAELLAAQQAKRQSLSLERFIEEFDRFLDGYLRES